MNIVKPGSTELTNALFINELRECLARTPSWWKPQMGMELQVVYVQRWAQLYVIMEDIHLTHWIPIWEEDWQLQLVLDPSGGARRQNLLEHWSWAGSSKIKSKLVIEHLYRNLCLLEVEHANYGMTRTTEMVFMLIILWKNNDWFWIWGFMAGMWCEYTEALNGNSEELMT